MNLFINNETMSEILNLPTGDDIPKPQFRPKIPKEIGDTSKDNRNELKKGIERGNYTSYELFLLPGSEFDASQESQFLKDSINENTLEELKQEHKWLEERLNYVFSSANEIYKSNGEDPLYIDDGESGIIGIAELFLLPKFTVKGLSLYNQIQAFNYKVADLQGLGITAIDIDSEKIGNKIQKSLDTHYAKRPPIEITRESIQELLKASHYGESFPGENTPEYIDVVTNFIDKQDTKLMNLSNSKGVLDNIPQDIKKYINFDYNIYLQNTRDIIAYTFQNILLEKNSDGGYRGINFDGKLSASEVQIAQYALGISQTQAKINSELGRIRNTFDKFLSEEKAVWGDDYRYDFYDLQRHMGKNKEGIGALSHFLISHPNDKVKDIAYSYLVDYSVDNPNYTIGNSLDGDYGNGTLLLVAVYQYGIYGENYNKVTGKINKETLLHMASFIEENL